MTGVFRFLRDSLFAIQRLFARPQTVDAADRFTPDADPTAPAFCARCSTRITDATALAAPLNDEEHVYELVCLACYTAPSSEPETPQ